MDLEIFKKSDPSGMLSRESYVLKNLPEEYDYIISYCNNINVIDRPFKEKVFICINDLSTIPTCKNPNCENTTKYKNSTLGYNEYCSNKCISSDPSIKKCKELKSLEKYGTKTPAESKVIKDKIIKTNQDRYGANSAMCIETTKEKSKETLLKNYGVENPSMSEELLLKRIKSFKNSSYKETYKKTSMEKYGVDHPWKNKNIHKKTIDNQIETKNINFKNITMSRMTDEILSFNYDNRTITAKCTEGHIYEISRYSLYLRDREKTKICVVCNPIESNSSGMEKLLHEFISDHYTGEIIRNSKKIIYPLEIDIYLPDLKIGFEFNGLYWHSDKQKDKDYHYRKFKLSEENGIKLISIWEDDWVMKNELVKSFILNQINRTSNRIYARNCEIKLVNYKESMSFLNSNHLQGDIKSPIRIGLYHNNDLVSLMTFSKLRIALSQKNNNELIYELTRFCNLSNTNIIGGASKLLKYFIKNYNPIEIHSYSDNCISSGNLYKTLGFEFSHESTYGYWYVVNDKREHRYNWRKYKLVEMGYDKNKTENQIMEELGYYRIYNAGNKKWVYYNNI